MIRRILVAFLLSPLLSPVLALELTFVAGAPEQQEALLEYEHIWLQDGARIVEALELGSGIALPETKIQVLVVEAQSNSGGGRSPMRLRASYPEAVKRGTLVHELAHRYLVQLRNHNRALSTHQKLNLLLLPVWESLWGPEFVAAQVAVESTWSEDYRRSWEWAMSLSFEARAAEWEKVRGR